MYLSEGKKLVFRVINPMCIPNVNVISRKFKRAHLECFSSKTKNEWILNNKFGMHFWEQFRFRIWRCTP